MAGIRQVIKFSSSSLVRSKSACRLLPVWDRNLSVPNHVDIRQQPNGARAIIPIHR